jgi:hypothetical protein
MAGKTFSPSMAELTLYAFQLAGLRPSSLLQEHIESARMATNMLLSTWSAMGVNLWEIDLQTVPLVKEQESYTVPNGTVQVLDAYITIKDGGRSIDRQIMPISRSEYATYPNKEQTGFPTVFWFENTLTPVIHLWPVPDGREVSFNYYRMSVIGASDMQGGVMPEIPQYFIEAFALGLSARLAAIWSPEKAAVLKAAADEAYSVAATANIENTEVYIAPALGGYYR